MSVSSSMSIWFAARRSQARLRAIGPVEPGQSAPRGRRSRRWRRTRCAGPAGRRGSRRCRGDALLLEQPRNALAKPRAGVVGSAIAGSTIFRHTEVLERVAGSAARKLDPRRCARPSRASTRGIGVGAGASAPQAADALAPSRARRSQSSTHSIEGVLMVSPSKMPSVELAALGQAEDLRQRPGGRGSRAARRRAATGPACHAPPRRPAPSARRRSRHRACPSQLLGEGGGGGVADGEALAVGGDPVAVRARARPRWCRSR